MDVNTKHVLMSGQTTLLLTTLQIWADNIRLLSVLCRTALCTLLACGGAA